MTLARQWAIISLGSLPETNNGTGSSSSLLDLAPGGGCLAACITTGAGGLLHHLFTIAPPALLPNLSIWGRAGEGVVCFCDPIR
jgi:hypothetical protein